MRWALAALALASHTGTAAATTYHIMLDERSPLRAAVSLDLPTSRAGDLALVVSSGAIGSLIGAPACGDVPLVARSATAWTVPASCGTVRWLLRLRDQDRDGMDAADPSGAWSAEGRWWLLTDRLAFLTPPGGWHDADVEMAARLRDGTVVRSRQSLPRSGEMPFYGVVSAVQPHLYRSRNFTLRVHGRVPDGADAAQQQLFADTWSRWRRDILPRGAIAPPALDMLWVTPPPHAEPNFMSSAGMRAVLMQNIPGPDRDASDARLRAAIIMSAHEGFHTLIGTVRQTWPVWVNESWASYFAWRAAQGHLDPAALKATRELIDAPASPSLLAIQAQVARGDGSNYEAFYGKGARFWAAIDAVLVTRRNPSGRLAALIQDTDGLKGLDWSSPDAIAAYFNARSSGRAGTIVHCYLLASDCG